MYHYEAEVYAKYTICACKLIGLIYLVAPLWGVPLQVRYLEFQVHSPGARRRCPLQSLSLTRKSGAPCRARLYSKALPAYGQIPPVPEGRPAQISDTVTKLSVMTVA